MEYKLTRKKIKRMIVRISEEGLVKVSAPFYLSIEQIETFLDEHRDWILKNKQKIKERKSFKNPFQAEYVEGQSLSIFGNTVSLHMEESQLSSFHLTENKLYVFYNKEEKKELSSKIQDYLFTLLYNFLAEELETYSKKLGLYPDLFKIKAMKSAWGIYHKRGNYISFSTLLLSQSKEFISYVVVHELCHIRFLNHQKEFWALVVTEIPNYQQIKISSRT